MYNIATVLLMVCLALSILCLLFGKVYVVNNYEIKVDCPHKDAQSLPKPHSESESPMIHDVHSLP